jgi:hypothetical protein
MRAKLARRERFAEERQMRLALPVVLAIAVSACAPQVVRAPEAAAPAQAKAWDGVFRTGDRVRIKSRSGTFKPEDTGHAVEVNGNAGRTGAIVTVLGESARVRWDAQTWDEFPPTGATAALKVFEATIHISFLQKL